LDGTDSLGASALVGRTFGRSRCGETRRILRDVAANPVLLTLASDGRLAAQVREGSERAFEVLVERHHRGLLAFCRSMLGSADEADDALQQTFLAAYRDLARGREPDALRPWLFGIARRRCLAILGARRAGSDAEAPEPVSDGLHSHVAAREDLRGIIGDLEDLPESQRTALVLAELGGVPHDDIAAILGCRREKVKALVFQARTSLATGRAARDTSCAEVRAELATVRGAVARRKVLRRHLRDCTDCQAFRDGMRGGRRALGLLLPGLGLKRLLLGGLLGSGGAGAGAGGLAATALVVIAIPVGGTAAVLTRSAEPGRSGSAPAARTTEAPAVAAAVPAAYVATPAAAPARPRTAKTVATPVRSKHRATAKRRGAVKRRAAARAPQVTGAPASPTRRATPRRAGAAPPGAARAQARRATPSAPPGQTKARPAKPQGRRATPATPATPAGRASAAGTVPASRATRPPTPSNPSAAH
jgi:RNA polymerase sigma factor (sigma-70 family)